MFSSRWRLLGRAVKIQSRLVEISVALLSDDVILYYLLPRLGASLQLVVVLCIFPIKAWMVGKMEVQQDSRGQLLGWLTRVKKKMKEEQATARRGGDVPLVCDPPREKTPPVAALHKSPHMPFTCSGGTPSTRI